MAAALAGGYVGEVTVYDCEGGGGGEENAQ